MLAIRWDTLIVAVVIGLTAVYLCVQLLLRVSVAQLIDARHADQPDLHARYADRRRAVVTPSMRVTLHDADDAEIPQFKPPRRQVS